MPTASWNEVPAELQQRVLDEGLGAVGDLAAWAYENRPGWLRNDDLHDLLCALIRFLVRADGRPERSIQSIPAILSAIAYRQRCQRFRDRAAVWTAQLSSEPTSDDAATPAGHLMRLELRASVWEALGTLNPKEREALLRKHVLDESYRDIAKAMYGPDVGATGVGRVSVMLTRARHKLRDVLKQSPG